MKVDRIIGIIDFMQQNGKTTMPHLAKKFNVSRRTICRDIDIICGSGIPIVTSQGVDGGIEIVKGFFFDTESFTKDELHDIFSGTKSLDNFSDSTENFSSTKYSTGNNAIPLSDNVMIDISSLYKETLAEKILTLKNAIRINRCVSFRHYTANGEYDIVAEPHLIIFRRSHWYLFGYCGEKGDFFLYKLNSLWNLQILQQKFSSREFSSKELHFNEEVTDKVTITALYDPDEKYKLVERRGPDSFSVTEEGKLHTRWCFPDYDTALSWFMSFGSKVKVLEPEDFRKIYVNEIKRALSEYNE